jgi:hypothetical protein
MQVKTEHGTLSFGKQPKPTISLAIAPQSSANLLAGIAIGAVIGFIVGAVVTLLMGERSLLLVQHLWNRLTGVSDEGDHVHFELLLQ